SLITRRNGRRWFARHQAAAVAADFVRRPCRLRLSLRVPQVISMTSRGESTCIGVQQGVGGSFAFIQWGVPVPSRISGSNVNADQSALQAMPLARIEQLRSGTALGGGLGWAIA